MKGHADPDVRLQAAVVIRAIETRLWGEVRRFLGHKGTVAGGPTGSPSHLLNGAGP